ncbi:zinc-binding dehydrogenase, partial [Mycobacterium attenuatum]|uniref:zinc-binding dehydrogenase n=1 Tax=Mycobacterium attenuatum TaxID=2341086 RepID=UPI001FCE4724
MVFSSRLSTHTHRWLTGHRVQQEVVFPATGFIEVLLQAGLHAECPVIDELVLHTPLVLSQEHCTDVQITIHPFDDHTRRAFSVHARTTQHPNANAWVLHATGTLSADPPEHWQTPPTPPPSLDPIDHDNFYDQLAGQGLHYDPPFRGLTHIGEHPGSPEIIYGQATLSTDTDTNGYNIHPALLDSALQAVFFAATDTENTLQLPFVLNGIHLHATTATSLHIQLIPTGTDTFKLHATDPTGAPVITIQAMTLRALPDVPAELTPSTVGLRHGLLELTWPILPRESSLAAELSPTCAFVGKDHPHLAARFGPDQTHPDLASVDLARSNLVVWALPLSTPDSDDVTLHAIPDGLGVDRLSRVHALTTEVLIELQQWLVRVAPGDAMLAILTRHAVSTSIHDRSPELAHAAVWGFIHSTQNEHPGRIHLIDVDLTTASEHTVLEILSTLRGPIPQSDIEPQLAIRRGTVHIPRLSAARQLTPPSTACWQLTTTGKGDLANLTLVPVAAVPTLATGQIRVNIRAAGLNFHDVVVALGAISDEGLGVEAAGVVIDVADDVNTVRPGDAVMGLFPSNSFAPTAVTDHRMVVAIPRGWSFTQAASVPAAFLTAYTALVELAGLGATQRVLVHAGTGGVGQAAIAIANHLGAEVYATAHPSKHRILEDLGLPRERIASSRTLDFLDLFTETTGGRGVDVVLDCLRGDFVDASLALLPRGGHFIEIGKADIRVPSEVTATCPGVTYQAYDLSAAPPGHIARTLGTLSELFSSGVLKPLPTTSYGLTQAIQAFRDMSQARHTGKIVLIPPVGFDGERTVLITGGTGMLGGVFAEHLITHYGVKHLLLVSRR